MLYSLGYGKRNTRAYTTEFRFVVINKGLACLFNASSHSPNEWNSRQSWANRRHNRIQSTSCAVLIMKNKLLNQFLQFCQFMREFSMKTHTHIYTPAKYTQSTNSWITNGTHEFKITMRLFTSSTDFWCFNFVLAFNHQFEFISKLNVNWADTDV